jgi:hypothetical protein
METGWVRVCEGPRRQNPRGALFIAAFSRFSQEIAQLMQNSLSPSINVFLSYSQADEDLCAELRKHLSMLRRKGVIRDWHDRQIEPGAERAKEIDERLDSAQIILLLVSADFLDSDYCYEVEMKAAIKRHEEKEAIVIPIILRPCDWQDAPFGKLQALPKNGQPVKSWPNLDEALTNIALGVRRVVEGFQAAPTPADAAQPRWGALVHRMCNRTAQEDDFYTFFHTHAQQQPGRPHIYFIRGPQQECPESLIERLTSVIVQEFAHDNWGAQLGVVASKLVDWPEPGDLSARRKRLVGRLYRDFDCEYKDDAPAAFAQAFTSLLTPVVALRHSIRADRWEQEKALIHAYLQFWDEVSCSTSKPLFLIFLTLLYPAQEKGRGWLSFFKRSGFDRDLLARDLMELPPSGSPGAACPRLILEELGGVEEHHVRTWFDKFGILEEGDRLRNCKELFRAAERRPMAEIELALKQIHREFIEQRGY